MLSALLWHCIPAAAVDGNHAGRLCSTAQLVSQGEIEGPVKQEISGLAASRSQPGVFWAHRELLGGGYEDGAMVLALLGLNALQLAYGARAAFAYRAYMRERRRRATEVRR